MCTIDRVFGQREMPGEWDVSEASERGQSRAIGKFAGVGGVLTTFLLLLIGQVTVAHGTCPSFGGPTDFGVGTAPMSVAVGDFNGDGKLDLAVANSGSNTVSILLGNSTGGFAPATPADHAVKTAPNTVAVGDFNEDGKADLAVTNSGAPGKDVSILLGTGTGDFGAATSFGGGPGELDARGMAVGDFNGDGHLDLAMVNHFFAKVAILLGDGTGSFGPRTDFGGVGPFPHFVAVADFNGDSRQDLAVGNAGSNTVSILLGTGTGSFGAATNFVVGPPYPLSAAAGVAVGDFNGDGRQDLAVSQGNSVSILLGDGTGGFGAPTSFAVGTTPFGVAVGDVNADGELDLAVANRGSNSVSILLGDGTGSLGAATNFTVGTSPNYLAMGDFNGDGQLDLAVSNTGSDNVSVLLNNCEIPVAIDIKPRSFPNSINPRSRGKIPVAILTTGTFDATTVDSTTVLFGATGTEAAPVRSALRDVDGDGDTDMILRFKTQDTGIKCGDTSASLTAETLGGQMIEGSDSIRTVGCR